MRVPGLGIEASVSFSKAMLPEHVETRLMETIESKNTRQGKNILLLAITCFLFLSPALKTKESSFVLRRSTPDRHENFSNQNDGSLYYF